MIKLFSRAYTMRFIIAHHLATPDFFINKITTFCMANNLTIKELEISNSIKKVSDSRSIIETSFVTIKGSKKEFEILKKYLREFHDAGIIVIMTV